MKKFALLGLLAALTSTISAPASAAQFKKAAKMENTAAQNLALLASKIAKNESMYGDIGVVTAFNILGNEDQETINTAKQLNHIKGGLNSDDNSGVDMNRVSAAKITEAQFEYLNAFEDENDERKHQENMKAYKAAIEAVKADSDLKIFGTAHGDEDGTWQILDIVDTANNQVLFIKNGFSGT